MLETHKQVFKEVLTLPPMEKIDLVDQILASLDRHDKEIDALWSQELENRLYPCHTMPVE